MPGIVEESVKAKETQQREMQDEEQREGQRASEIRELQASITPEHVEEVAKRLGYVPDDIENSLRQEIGGQREIAEFLGQNPSIEELRQRTIHYVVDEYSTHNDLLLDLDKRSLQDIYPKYEPKMNTTNEFEESVRQEKLEGQRDPEASERIRKEMLTFPGYEGEAQSLTREETRYAPLSEEYIESRRLRGREDTLQELRDSFLAQVEYDHAQSDPQKQNETARKVTQWATDTVNAEERYDVATLKNGIHPADAAFREGQKEGVKEFEAKHGLVEATKIENLTDAITEKLRNAESNIEKHWIQHPYGHEEYYRGVADSVNSLHSLLEKHAPELAQNLPPKIDLHQIAERVEQSIHQKQAESISIGAF
jgi:hypothetical protein